MSTEDLYLALIEFLRHELSSVESNPPENFESSILGSARERNSLPLDKDLIEKAMKLLLHESDIFVLSNPQYSMGKATYGVKVGDVLCVLLGCSKPMVLRPVGGHYELVAEAWVPGVMYGETVEGLKEGEWKLHEFELH